MHVQLGELNSFERLNRAPRTFGAKLASASRQLICSEIRGDSVPVVVVIRPCTAHYNHVHIVRASNIDCRGCTERAVCTRRTKNVQTNSRRGRARQSALKHARQRRAHGAASAHTHRRAASATRCGTQNGRADRNNKQ